MERRVKGTKKETKKGNNKGGKKGRKKRRSGSVLIYSALTSAIS